MLLSTFIWYLFTSHLHLCLLLQRSLVEPYDRVDISEASSLSKSSTFSSRRTLNSFFCHAAPRFPQSFLWSLLPLMGLAAWPPCFRPGCRAELHTFIMDCDTELPVALCPPEGCSLIHLFVWRKRRPNNMEWKKRGSGEAPRDSVAKPNKRTWDWYYEA